MRAALARLRRAHERVLTTGDRGSSMIEVFVGMIIMTIAGSIFTGAVVTLNRTSNQAQAISDSATQNNQAYQALDKTVRYAAAISTPGIGSGSGGTARNWYVEFRDTTSGIEVCTQLQVDIDSRQMQRRTWNASDISTLSDWVPIASNVTNGTASSSSDDRPFVLEPATASARHQTLTFTVVSSSGPANQRVTSRSRFSLTALNSTLPPATGAICQQAGRK